MTFETVFGSTAALMFFAPDWLRWNLQFIGAERARLAPESTSPVIARMRFGLRLWRTESISFLLRGF
jgi:hypothetical protein